MTLGRGTWVGFLLCLLLSAAMAAAAPQWISLNDATEAAPAVEVLDHNNSQTRLHIQLNGFWMEEVEEAGETYKVLSLDSWATTMDVGSPMLPKIIERVGIPARSDLHLRVSNLETVSIPDYRIYPFQTPTTDETTPVPFVIDQQAYNLNDLYPSAVATVSQPHIWRDVRLTELHLSPIRYNPANRELVIATSFDVVIEYRGINNHNALDKEPTAVNPNFDRLYRAGLINYDHMGLDVSRLDEPGTKYLFVMKPEAQPYVQELIDFRHAQGYKTEVRHIESPGFDDEYEIKAYIDELYYTTGLEYVLLVGDAYYSGGPSAVDVPMYYWQVGTYPTYSDSWYVSLQGNNDYYADLAIGRIVYDGATDLTHQLDKIMAYLTTPEVSNWAEHSLLVAHQEQYPLKYTQCKEEIRTYPYSIQVPIFGTAYGGAGATNQDVINYLNTNSSGVLNYRGHGSQTAWIGWSPSGSFTATHVNQLTNFDRYFVHFDVCCDNMDFPGYNGDCLAETFMKAPAAAIAVHGAIVPSYTDPNHDYDKEFYKGLYNEGIWNIGYTTNFANITVVNNWGIYGQSNYRTYLWLGDACTDLWTDIPEQLATDYASTVNLATEDFAVTVTKNSVPIENALVCAQSDFAYARGFTNSSGVAYLVFSELPETTTDVTITASAHNGLPATGTCTVIPTGSPYDLLVQMTPTGSTSIPPTGGTISYNGQVQNNEIYPLETVIWTDWIYPNGDLHDPFIYRPSNLYPAVHIERDLNLMVSGSEPAGTYTYRLCVGTYQGGAIFAMDTFEFTKSALDEWLGEPGEWVIESGSTPWDDDVVVNSSAMPKTHSLSQHPNPFNPETTILYALPEGSKVTLTIYNTLGQQVAVLVDGFRTAGVHEVTFNAGNLPSGVYVSDLRTGNTHLTNKMVLLK